MGTSEFAVPAFGGYSVIGQRVVPRPNSDADRFFLKRGTRVEDSRWIVGMSEKKYKSTAVSSLRMSEVEAFLEKVERTPAVRSAGRSGRLIFALDATASRQATWDVAMDIQAQMFAESSLIGRLSVQLVYYRGFQEFFAGQFSSDPAHILRDMAGGYCVGGRTQITQVLQHALKEHKNLKVDALILVGDACEENIDLIADLAGQMGVNSLPVFAFHEGPDVEGRRAFEQISRLSGGVFNAFDSSSPETLRRLLSEVAIFAVGGRDELRRFQKQSGQRLIRFDQRN